MAGYYKRIKGKNYDRELIEMADDSVAGKGDGRISLADAKKLLSGVKDADAYTDIEKRTMKYIRDKYKFTKEADKWFRTEIRKWAGKRGAKKKPTPTKPKKKTKKVKQSSKPAAAASAAAISSIPEPSPVLMASEPEEEQEERTALWKILWVLPLIILLFIGYYALKGKDKGKQTDDSQKIADTQENQNQDQKAQQETTEQTQEKKQADQTTEDTNSKKTVSAAQVTATKIQFKKGKSIIRKAERRKLKKVIVYLKENPSATLTVVGHTCNLGGEQVNNPLSLKRAKKVANYLLKKGAPEKQIITRGNGQANPIASNKSAKGRIKNRRVEFSLQ